LGRIEIIVLEMYADWCDEGEPPEDKGNIFTQEDNDT
jgi:hypothetical protein